jgi:hypothetical protein
MNAYTEDGMNKGGCHGVMDEASFSSLPLTGRLLSSTATWEVSFE